MLNLIFRYNITTILFFSSFVLHHIIFVFKLNHNFSNPLIIFFFFLRNNPLSFIVNNDTKMIVQNINQDKAK